MRIKPLWVFYATLIILTSGGSLFAAEGVLTINSITPGNSQAGATTIYTFEIKTSPTGNGIDVGIPRDGWISIEFPSSFNLSNVELAQAISPGMTGGFDSVKVIDHTIHLRRDSTGNDVGTNKTVSFKVGNIKNANSGSYSVIFLTKTKAKTHIDRGTYNPLVINNGSLSYIRIEDAPNSSGNEIGDISRTADQTISMYAAGYDELGNYLGDQSVNWNVSGNIGNLSVTTGTSTVLTLTTVGVGNVNIDNGSSVTDNTGNITVSPGSLYNVKIVEGESGSGTGFTTRSLTTDQSLTIHAAGYDADGNYTGDISVTWSVTNNIGQFSSSPAVNTVFNATKIGTGRISANHATANDYQTGDITVNGGNLSYVKIVAGAGGNGIEYTTNSIQAGQSFTVHAAGYDTDQNYLGDQNVNWIVGNGIGTVNPSSNVTSTTFTGTMTGTGWIKADHSTATDDATEAIDVTPGPLDNLKIRTGSNDGGQIISNLDTLLYIDETLTLYSAGYDDYDNYISDVEGTWNNTGDLDFAGPINGSSIDFNPLTGETSGKIYVSKSGVDPDTTGTITISGINSIKLTTSTGPSATELNDYSMTVDESLVLYASAYDSRGNYLDTVTVDWTVLTKDTVINLNSNKFTFAPHYAPDTVKIYGTFGAVADDSTGNIYIAPGAPMKEFNILPNLNELTANGTDLTRVTSDTIFDRYGNKILPNELFTITVSPKSLGTSFGTLYVDQDSIIPGHQVKSDLDGQITFEIQAGTNGGTAFISASSINGIAYADTAIILSAIRARQINIVTEKVSQGQDSVEISFLVQNVSTNEVTDFSADLKFRSTTGTKLDSYFDVSWDSVGTLLPQQSKTLDFRVDVANNAPPGGVIVDGRISGLVSGTTTLQDTAVGVTDTILVQTPPVINIVSVTAPKDTVEQGTNTSVYLSVE
ncbi:hypothetical protein GF337_19715, partial [candidate division KSB1 bacterium]|nr:hypothetical protein [candidate division KSB1 bacterium]